MVAGRLGPWGQLCMARVCCRVPQTVRWTMACTLNRGERGRGTRGSSCLHNSGRAERWGRQRVETTGGNWPPELQTPAHMEKRQPTGKKSASYWPQNHIFQDSYMNAVYTRGKEIIFPQNNTALKFVEHIPKNTVSNPSSLHEEATPKILGTYE